jgi:DNA repair exonuclease SbcCD ATPase subunit
MLHLNALKLEINTTNGLYGTTIQFESGLNIIRANNTSGKSTVFQSILYALGFEELIGLKNEKTMQSVLKDVVIDGEKSYQVVQSAILLEIFNGVQTITIKRSVVNEKRKPQLIDVSFGPLITENKGIYEIRQMYVHDKGAASDEIYGFHAFLEEFLNWNLPNVIDINGNSTKLYMPLIAPTFIIEQKSGWSSFFATIPYYGVKNAEERVIEFLLNLDVFQNEQSRISLNINKRLLQEKWSILFEDFHSLAEKGGAEIAGLEAYPVIINNINEIYFRIFRNDRYILIPDLIEELTDEFDQLNQQTEITVGENLERNQSRLNTLSDGLLKIGFRYQQLSDEQLHEKEKFRQYTEQKKAVQEDLDKNKSAEKMLRLGGDVHALVASNICPTCGQGINDSLLPHGVDQVPMQIADNINFLVSQLKMLEAFINSQRSKIQEKDNILAEYTNRLNQIRQEIRNIKKDLVSDERLPSEELIERKINTKRLANFYEEFLEKIESMKKRLSIISKEWETLKKKETELSGDFFTILDREKLQSLQDNFLRLLRTFNYQSKDNDAIKISAEKYLPVIEVKLPNEKPKSYDIRFDSSGSDHIRCMWAYYIALLNTSKNMSGNHPKLLIFDEPQQQSASTDDFHEFLKELSTQNDAQSLVFASFQNSIEDFDKATQGLTFTKIESTGKFILKISE